MMAQHPSDAAAVLELIRGHWRSQIVQAGVEIGVFEQFPGNTPLPVHTIAQRTGADAHLLYRLLRALASLGLLLELPERAFAISPMGRLLRRDDPRSLREMVLPEDDRPHEAAWRQPMDAMTFGSRGGIADGLVPHGFAPRLPRDASRARVFEQASASVSAFEMCACACASPRRSR
ncbi:methyltransferase family protein [Arenibaculum pallidiluteum]|uniref:methyltransferase family protein n=1 Tax=Arenibaculum pallidiluteum TaxID=2812559 RepID=UPI001A959F97|nr:methyltransferase dimerization domain-containing protein [Arenibaculum pallidiluteum]